MQARGGGRGWEKELDPPHIAFLPTHLAKGCTPLSTCRPGTPRPLPCPPGPSVPRAPLAVPRASCLRQPPPAAAPSAARRAAVAAHGRSRTGRGPGCCLPAGRPEPVPGAFLLLARWLCPAPPPPRLRSHDTRNARIFRLDGQQRGPSLQRALAPNTRCPSARVKRATPAGNPEHRGAWAERPSSTLGGSDHPPGCSPPLYPAAGLGEARQRSWERLLSGAVPGAALEEGLETSTGSVSRPGLSRGCEGRPLLAGLATAVCDLCCEFYFLCLRWEEEEEEGIVLNLL